MHRKQTSLLQRLVQCTPLPALLCCAPPIAGPPVVPMHDHKASVGGVSGLMRELEPHPHNARPRNVTQVWAHAALPMPRVPADGSGSLRLTEEPAGERGTSERGTEQRGDVLLGIMCFGELGDETGCGGYVRTTFYTSPVQNAGVQVAGGMYFASIGLPVSRHIWRDTWLYSNPTFGFVGIPSLLVPIGISMPVGKRARFHIEFNTTEFPAREGRYAGAPNFCNGEELGDQMHCRRQRAMAGFTASFGKR